MITLKRLFHFFGGIYFAIILIALTACFVISGTLLESYFQSHRFAAYFTYSNPLFKLLLWGFFVNILFAALRRWPFKPRHIPFLLTHLGLLMILAGVLIKSYFGTQGNMRLIEGSGSHFLAKPNSYSLYLEKRNPHTLETISSSIALEENWMGIINSNKILKSDFSNLTIQPINFLPHTTEHYETWIKGDLAYINGNQPFKVSNANKLNEFPISGQIPLGDDKRLWDVIACKTSDINTTAKKIYAQNTAVIISDSLTHAELFQGVLKDLLAHPLNLSNMSLSFDLQFDPIANLPEYKLFIFIQSPGSILEKMVIPLNGEQALQNINSSSPHFGKLPITIDLQIPPTLLLLQNEIKDISLFAFSPHGQIYEEAFNEGAIQSVIMYDQGFGGYTMQANIPLDNSNISQYATEKQHLEALIENLELYSPPAQFEVLDDAKAPAGSIGQSKQKALVAPLKSFQQACLTQQAPFAKSFVDFLAFWNNTHHWILPANTQLPSSITHIIDKIDWNAIPITERKTCLWLNSLYSEIEPHLQRGEDILTVLKATNWPLLSQLIPLKESAENCSPKETAQILTALSQQLYAVADQLPEPEINDLNAIKGRLFTAYLQLYEIHLRNFPLPLNTPESFISIECPLTLNCSPEKPLKQIEDNVPAINLIVNNGQKREEIQLTYDPSGQGLKWPLFSGEYLLRLQPQFEEIPHHIRLRQGRQINHLNSNQPYSYEADIIITDRRTGHVVEKTLSMNHVHETHDGYRFYLSNISSSNENSAKQVQLTINRDPTKYFLTYAGAVILCIGIFLLFWAPFRS